MVLSTSPIYLNNQMRQNPCLVSVLLVVLLSTCSSSSSDSHDTDSDLVDDAVDNCPSVYNPNQIAFIGNYIVLGDACDDEDADGIVDATDNCPLTDNVDQLDTDGNGVGDVCDSCEELALAADIWTGPGSSNPVYFTVLQDRLFFRANDGISGEELWMYNESEGATLAANVAPGSGASLPAPMAAMGGKLYFSASDGVVGHTLWVYDPARAEADLIKTADTKYLLGSPIFLTPVNGKLYFSASYQTVSTGVSRQGLWVYDPTDAGAGSRLLADFDNDFRVPKNLAALDGTLYFTRRNEDFGTDLWVHDSAEMDMAPDVLLPDIALTEISGLFPFAGRLFTIAGDRQNEVGEELWAFDPLAPEAGFSLLADIMPGSGNSAPSSLTTLNGMLYFTANDPTYGRSLWVHDPTQVESATSLIGDILPGSTNISSTSVFLNALNDKLYLNLASDDTLQKIMVYDPANPSDGVVPVLNASEYSDIDWSYREVAAFDSKLYFLASDPTHGSELWAYDPDCQP